MKTYICIIMAAIMSNIPHIALAEVSPKMISTASVVEEMSRAQAQRKVEEILSQTEIKSRLAEAGLSPSEISNRLATLSDSELRQLASQLDHARYGGDPVTGILVIAVLVLLIIYLAKRI